MEKTKLFMDTVVTIQVVTRKSKNESEAAIERAFEAFRKVEHACSRFSLDSELMEASRQIKIPVPISPFLFEPLKFALEVAKWTKGIFDPAVGKTMEDHGFNQHYLTGETIQSSSSVSATYRDVVLNEQDRTLYLQKPLVIDLGGVAKGFAIDLAAHELKQFEGFVVNAGGDLYAGGVDEKGRKWKIDIQHPEHKEQMIQTVEISNEAVCTSGSYERKSTLKNGVHHIIDPRSKQSPNEWISCSVIAPYAMMADAFSTASFLLGLDRGRTLIEQLDLRGILITSDLQIYRVGGI
ncbi:FAD:protein FMN transferase [Paenibacillus radicis (ex Xue et al. 2023)]|uniref:FAD:protein FMN transferase n=1 Tax=Paenibacillus radicis (ex Xue et al. 2023) TaxID=2972489 RepID=A0ABT1Y9Y4_9BACL|nr:FAD:protein FMN transferase [Paenibacillus radicis (ex Xue et al. 2023)]MCR8629988.1 FAD:protein FMN transferase [Paenibacillus radicis (ex Xue et al. 2023)]